MTKPSKSKEAISAYEKWYWFYLKQLTDLHHTYRKTLARIKFDSEGNMLKEGKAYAYALKHFPHLLEKYEGKK